MNQISQFLVRIHRCSHKFPQFPPAIPTLPHSSSDTASPVATQLRVLRSSRVFSPLSQRRV
eukprot:scaffold61328_cov68-Phaeocystis_antarctica.AAC.3